MSVEPKNTDIIAYRDATTNANKITYGNQTNRVDLPLKILDEVGMPLQIRVCDELEAMFLTNSNQNQSAMPGIEKVIFNDPATIVMWSDGTKTVVKTHKEKFSEEHGLAMAVARKYFGSRRMFRMAVEGAKGHEEEKPKAAKKTVKTVKRG